MTLAGRTPERRTLAGMNRRHRTASNGVCHVNEPRGCLMPVPRACLSWYQQYLAAPAAAGQDGDMTTMTGAGTTTSRTATGGTTTSRTTTGGTTTGRTATGRMATGDDRVRRVELGAFLRSRRERITPEEAGLLPGFRRRTSGLRREE